MNARGTKAILTLAVVLVPSSCSTELGPSTGGTHTVTYRVTGSAPSVDVTYQNANRDVSQEADRPLPWSTTIQAASGDFVYISAQNQGESGEVTCAIDVDGTTAEANTSTGAYTICTASGKL